MNRTLKTQWRGLTYVTLSAVLYGVLGYLGTQLIAEHFTIENMLFWRFFIAWVWICCLLVFFARHDLQRLFPLPSIKTLSFTVLCYSGSSLFYFFASQHIGTGIAMVVFFSYPIFVFLFSWMLSGWTWNVINGAALFFLCLGLFFLKGNGSHALTWQGLLYATIASLSYALYVYGSQFNPKSVSTLLMTFFVCLGNALLFFIYALCTHSLMLPASASAWGYVLGIGIIATALPIQLLLEGLKVITPIKVSILSVFEPVITVLIGVWLLHESMSNLQALGIVIVLCAALLIQFDRFVEKQQEG